MNFLKKRRTQILFLLIIFIAVYTFDSQYNKPHLNVEHTEPSLLISSEQLLKSFEENENESNSKYLDQVLEVTGKIAHISLEDNKVIIALGKASNLGNVVCHLLPSETEKTKTLKKGQIISLKGICTGYLMDVILVKSVLTQ